MGLKKPWLGPFYITYAMTSPNVSLTDKAEEASLAQQGYRAAAKAREAKKQARKLAKKNERSARVHAQHERLATEMAAALMSKRPRDLEPVRHAGKKGYYLGGYRGYDPEYCRFFIDYLNPAIKPFQAFAVFGSRHWWCDLCWPFTNCCFGNKCSIYAVPDN